jgi:DNA-binding GntR family transcriptional regulator
VKASLSIFQPSATAARSRRVSPACGPELYQQMLRDISEQVRLADDPGYDSVSFTEHHFHIEAVEVSNNPVLLDLYFAMQTKRIWAWRRPARRSRSRRAMRWSERPTRLPAHSKSCAAACRSNGCFATPNNSLVPHDVLMKTIERFWIKVMPRVA